MTIKYLIDHNGRVFPAKHKSKHKGWRGTFAEALKECGDSGRQFLKECEQGADQFSREITNTKRRR